MTSLRGFIADLKKQGYSVKLGASVRGKSGALHKVSGVARRTGGKRGTLIWVEGHEDTTAGIIKTFAIAYDVGAEACFVTGKKLTPEDRRLADYYRMKVLTVAS